MVKDSEKIFGNDDSQGTTEAKIRGTLFQGIATKRRIIHSVEKAKETGKVAVEVEEDFHPLKHLNELSPKIMRDYFSYPESLDLFHKEEREIIQGYYKDKRTAGTMSEKFSRKVRAYNSAWRKFDINLKDKKKALGRIQSLLDSENSQERISQELKIQLKFFLESQKMMDFAREKLSNHFHAIQLEELLAQIEEGKTNADIRNSIFKMSEEQQLMFEKIENFQQSNHDMSTLILIRFEELRGAIAKGGIRYLEELLEKTPLEMGRIFSERFFLLSQEMSKDDWKIYYLHRKGISNIKIAPELECSVPTIGRKLKKIDALFKKHELPSSIEFYVRRKKEINESRYIQEVTDIEEE